MSPLSSHAMEQGSVQEQLASRTAVSCSSLLHSYPTLMCKQTMRKDALSPYRAQPKLRSGPENPNGNLTTVGSHNFFERGEGLQDRTG